MCNNSANRLMGQSNILEVRRLWNVNVLENFIEGKKWIGLENIINEGKGEEGFIMEDGDRNYGSLTDTKLGRFYG